MEELIVDNFETAVALLAYGIPLIEIKNNEKGKYFYSFQPSPNAHNILTLYLKQHSFLTDALEKKKHMIGKIIQGKKTKFGGLKEAYKDSTRKIKGAPQKSNGTWKA